MPHPIVGTWALVSSQWKRADGRHANPFGDGAVGVLMYDAAGYMAAQIMRADRLPAPSTAAATIDAAFASAVPGYVAYFGTYEVDDAAGVVTHRVIAASHPSWAGGVQERAYSVDGDELTLSADLETADGVAVAASTTWRRAS